MDFYYYSFETWLHDSEAQLDGNKWVKISNTLQRKSDVSLSGSKLRDKL